MNTNPLKEITWQELKDFCNSIPAEFLDKKVNILVSDNSEGQKLNEPYFLPHDVWCHKDGFPEDECGELDEVMQSNVDFDKNNYYIVTKKGTPFLYADYIDC